MYDLEKDPLETTNLAHEIVEQPKQVQQEFERLRRKLLLVQMKRLQPFGNPTAMIEDLIDKLQEFIDLNPFNPIRFTNSLPKTRSGKIMRRLLRDIASGRDTVGDTTTLDDYSVLARLRESEEG